MLWPQGGVESKLSRRIDGRKTESLRLSDV